MGYNDKGTNTEKAPESLPEMKEPSQRTSIPDGGWGWVITFASFMVSFLVDGVCFTFGIFFPEFLRYFGESKGKTQILGSVINGTYLSLGPIAGALVNNFGCRKVAITGAFVSTAGLFLSTFSPDLTTMILLYGVVGGIGFGLIYLPAIVMVGYYFDKRRAFATGIAVCGSGIGGFVFAPISVILLEMYGWKGALWVISGIVFHGVIFASLYRPLTRKKSTSVHDFTQTTTCTSDSETVRSKGDIADNQRVLFNQKCCLSFKESFDFTLLASPTFIVYGISCFLCMFGFYIPFNFLPALVKDIGLSESEGALLISIIGISNTVARIVIGFVSDKPWADCLLINNVALFIGGAVTCFVPYYEIFGILATYSVLFGAAIATFVSLRSIIMVELMGIERLTSSFGLVVLCQGLSAFIGSPIAGVFADETGDYNITFYLSGVTLGLAGLICFPLRRIAKWEYKRKLESDDTAPDVTVTETENCSYTTEESNEHYSIK